LYLADRWHRLHLACTWQRGGGEGKESGRGSGGAAVGGWGAVHAHKHRCVVLLSGFRAAFIVTASLSSALKNKVYLFRKFKNSTY